MTQDATEDEQGEEDESNSASPVEIARYVAQAARRHAKLGAVVAVVLAVLGIAVALAIPPTFASSSKILITQGALVTPSLSNPNRNVPNVDPTRGAEDLMMQRETLQAIVREADLPSKWESTRTSVLRAKDWVMQLMSGPLAEQEKVRALADVLEKRLVVRPENNNSLRIIVSWGDALMAAKLAKIFQERFLQTRRTQETAPVTAAIEILEAEVIKSADAIEPELRAIELARRKSREPSKPAADQAADSKVKTPVAIFAKPTKPLALAQADRSLSTQLNEIREAIRAAQDPWRRRVSELTVQLGDLRGVYGPAHPAVVQQEKRIQEASVEPAELADLRQREQTLLSQIQSASTEDTGSGVGSARFVSSGARPVAASATMGGAPAPLEEAPEVAAARSKLMAAIYKYNELRSRIDAARLELTTAEAAFKYRYVVVEAPEPARRPVKPNRLMLILASLAAALGLGFLAGAARELASGRMIEVWQVRLLRLPVVAEVDLGPGRPV